MSWDDPDALPLPLAVLRWAKNTVAIGLADATVGWKRSDGTRTRTSFRAVWRWFWEGRPTRCITCRRWFDRDFFWNPWGPGSGPGLTCSLTCCNAVKRQLGKREYREEDFG